MPDRKIRVVPCDVEPDAEGRRKNKFVIYDLGSSVIDRESDFYPGEYGTARFWSADGAAQSLEKDFGHSQQGKETIMEIYFKPGEKYLILDLPANIDPEKLTPEKALRYAVKAFVIAEKGKKITLEDISLEEVKNK